MASGTRKVGMREQMGYGRNRKAPPALTPEQKAASRALMESHLRKMAIDGGVPLDQVEAWVAEKAA